MTTVTVDGDGSGDYNCTGVDDQNVINSALEWAYTDGIDSNPSTVYLNGPCSYLISNQLYFGSNTILTGDSTAVIKVQDYTCGNNITYGSPGASCVFPDGKCVMAQMPGTVPSNVEIFGFEIDGNCQNQYTKLGLAHGVPSSAGSGVERMIGFFGSSTGANINGVKVHDMHFHDAFGESLIIRFGKNIQFYNNKCENHQHETVYYIGVVGSGNTIDNNIIQGISSDCIRCSNSQGIDIHHNSLSSYLGSNNNGAALHGQSGIQICNESNKSILTNSINIHDNIISDQGLAGVWIDDQLRTAGNTPQSVTIYNNTITGCGWSCWANWASGISIGPWGNGITIEANTIDGSYQDGIQILSAISAPSAHIVNIKYNNIINTRGKRYGSSGSSLVDVGYGIYNAVLDTVTIVNSNNNYFIGNLNGDYLGQINTITDEIVTGQLGLMIPTKTRYMFYRLQEAVTGDTALIYPAPGGEYYLLKLTQDVAIGNKMLAIPGAKGDFYGVSTE